jgi:hypothetical protein
MRMPKLRADQDRGARRVELFRDPKCLTTEAMAEQYRSRGVSAAYEPKGSNRVCKSPCRKRRGRDAVTRRGLTDASVVDADHAHASLRKPITNVPEDALRDADSRQCEYRRVRSADGFVDPTPQ